MSFLWPSGDDQLTYLLERARQGDERSFTQLYRQLHGLVYGFIRRRSLHESDAEDMTAHVFHTFLARMSQFDRKRGSVRAWVITIARNALIDRLRSKKTHIDVNGRQNLMIDSQGTPLDNLLKQEQWQQLKILLGKLDTQMQEILVLHFGDGLRYREIAEILGLNESTVKKRVSRCQRNLKLQLAQTEAGEASSYAV